MALRTTPRPRFRGPLSTLALACAVLLGLAPAATAAVLEAPVDGEWQGWYAYGQDGAAYVSDSGAFCADVPAGSSAYGVGVVFNGLGIEAGESYVLGFTASASEEVTIRVAVGENGGAYRAVTALEPTLAATASYSHGFTAAFGMPAVPADGTPEGQLAFQLGGHLPEAWTFCLDGVSLTVDDDAGPGEMVELLPRTSFATGVSPFSLWPNDPVHAGGEMCLAVPGTGAGFNPWDAGLNYTSVEIVEGNDYRFSFTARAEPATRVRVVVGEEGGAYRSEIDTQVALGESQTYSYDFTAVNSYPSLGAATGQVAFHLGAAEDYTFCIESISLTTSGEPPAGYEPDTGPRVRVNQVGYLPEGPKSATLVTDQAEPVTWELHGASGVVASGLSLPRGLEESSGLTVHEIDFGDVATPGEGYTLVADGETSHPFAISGDLYSSLRTDSLAYFYLARSGIEIDAALVGEEYAREAGHVGVAPNQGDTEVPCISPRDYYSGWTCDITHDVAGGWYDAGDFGKYVVNGGIAVYQLMSAYERTQNAPTADAGALADGSLAIPETGNAVPDVLDEARWQLEWILSMQVPASQPYAGMAYHKVHDEAWAPIPQLPAESSFARSIHRPSTAATLNLAAVAAQGARLFAPYDVEFSAELLAAARTAWQAALDNPELFAPAEAGNDGGGAYPDDDVSDEFYWAAAELYITTAESEFAAAVLASDAHTAEVFDSGGFYWGEVGALGRLSLATVPNALPGRQAVRDSVVAAADRYLAAQAAHPFGTAYTPDDGVYVWGSNSSIANIQVVLATAFDLTGHQPYRDSVVESMDYLLGRNALNVSYVTGYGEVFSTNQHSRWFAHQADAELPPPPDGALAGGPNSDAATWDPVIQALYPDGCAPQLCYVDELQSWSTNEITVNWNSSLAWVASFLADQGSGGGEPGGAVVSVVEHPGDVSVESGDTATLAAAATGSPAPAVQWQALGDDGAWLDVPGATDVILALTASLSDDGAQYRAIFSNVYGWFATEPATLTVTPAPAVEPTAGPTADPTVAPSPTVEPTVTAEPTTTPSTESLPLTGPDGGVMWAALAALVLVTTGAAMSAGRRRRGIAID